MTDPKIEKWEVSRLTPYENNVKKHDQKQVNKIAESIRRFGWRGNPILVDENGVIIAGHGRRLAAMKLGLIEVPVEVIVGKTEDEINALRLADNRVAIGEYDSDLLQAELANIDFDLDGIFDKKELDFLVADLAEMKTEAFVLDLDEEVKAQAEATTKKIAEADEKLVKIEKALGFKQIQGRDERWVARFMAQIEAETGKIGAEAFVGFVRNLMQAQAAAA
ncbi:MAG: ParB/Srx family N-terminal domain-containing protein [Betaproteobacteria bacterium]|nr:ParB/Srx family N-terminal domain-containing protein [Betaproteobacteria bacterium]